jgi:quinol monooxygenase YgiN
MYSLISVWTIKRGKERAAVSALKRLAKEVQKKEKKTLTYLVHVPDMSQPSIPTPSPLQVVFFEIYQDNAAFLTHLNGPIFNGFVNRHKDLFLCTTVAARNGEKITRPYVSAEILKRIAGFVRA